jgi:hypothetical protein
VSSDLPAAAPRSVLLRSADEQPVGDAESVIGGQRLEDRRDVVSPKQLARDGAVVLDDRHVKGQAGPHEVLEPHPQGAGPIFRRRCTSAVRCLVEKQAEGPAHVLHDRVLKPELLEGDPRHELTQPVEPSHIVKGGIGDVQVVVAEEDKVTTPQRLASMLVPATSAARATPASENSLT